MDLLKPIALLALVAISACSPPRPEDCSFSCASSEICPSGLECRAGMCRSPSAAEPCPSSTVDGGAEPDAEGPEVCSGDMEICPEGCPCLQAIAASARHTCVLHDDGDSSGVSCWGDNEYNQLTGIPQSGFGGTTPRTVDITAVTQIAAGDHHTCARHEVGDVYCWGRNQSAQLGTDLQATGPVLVIGETATPGPAAHVAAGAEHSCALLEDGSVLCWGSDLSGQLGDGNGFGAGGPEPVPAVQDAKAIAAGAYHSCAVQNDGSAVCWGDNTFGGLGIGGGGNQEAAAQVDALDDVEEISAGVYHTCARTTTGEVWCWGSNYKGELGLGHHDDEPSPRLVMGLPEAVAQIDCGGYHSCARTVSGEVWCWGENDDGEIDQSADERIHTPRRVPGICGASFIAAGFHHNCANTTSGVLCWGWNQFGQLGSTAAGQPKQAAITCEPEI